MSVYTDRAVALFEQGCSCSQSVFGAFASDFGMDAETAMKVSAGLGGGVGRLRETCGCVTGAALVLGMKYGNATGSDQAAKGATYTAVQDFAAAFKAENGSVVCRELLAGVPKTTTGGAPEARTAEYYEKRPCKELVRLSAEILEKQLGL